MLRIWKIKEGAKLRQIRSDNVGIFYKLLHLAAHGRGIGWIQLAVVTHDGIDDNKILLVFKVFDKVDNYINLFLRAEKSCGYGIELQLQIFVCLDVIPHFWCVVIKVKYRKLCMCR